MSKLEAMFHIYHTKQSFQSYRSLLALKNTLKQVYAKDKFL